MHKRFAAAILTAAMLIASMPAVAAATPKLMPEGGHADYTNVIDVSHHESPTSWAAIRQNTSVIYIKATEGTGYTDPSMDAWAAGAAENRVGFGFYHYFWPRTSDAAEQAREFVSAISRYNYNCLPAIDVEETATYRGGSTVDRAGMSQAVSIFRETVKQLTGHDCILYVGPYFARDNLDSTAAAAPLWIADYRYGRSSFPGSEAPQWTAWRMWQYTESASWPGVSGHVDADKATSGIYISGAPVAAGSQPVPAVTARVQRGNPTTWTIQCQLNDTGIARPQLDTDGISGPATREQIRVLEQVAGVAVDSGVWGPQCVNAIGTIYSHPALRRGDRGVAVRYLQYMLGLPIDGIYGAQTEAAVMSRQAAAGIDADGIVGPVSWQVIGG